MEINELNKNANGGTELMQRELHQRISPELLENFQIICSRPRELKKDKKKILWLHDLHADPEVRHLANEGWKQYDKLVFVSNWQLQMYNVYLGVPYSHSIVLKNAITPIEDHEKPNDGIIRLIYFSTPHRGLEILYPVFSKLCEEFDNIELNVYSSFKLYGWEERDKPFKNLFDKLNDHPKINNHGSVSNAEIREALKKSDIFAYPSIWQETSCLCLIEAMSAGLVCVHPNYAALPETSMGGTLMYQWSENMNQHANTFYYRLRDAIVFFKEKNLNNMMGYVNVQKYITDTYYSWETREVEWTNFLTKMKG